jgi:hypothetical protein
MYEEKQPIKKRIGLFQTMAAGILFSALMASGQTDPNTPTTQWVPLLYGNNIMPDPSGDQQTGNAELDIVGNASTPSLYMQYTSGYLGFRLRLGAELNPPGFSGVALVGMDVTLNGALDLFLGVNNQGSHDQIGIWLPGLGANTAPNNTGVGSLVKSYKETTLTYGFTPISSAIDPTTANFDLNADGRTDRFLSFFVPFADIASALATKDIIFTTNSLMDLMVVTGTQPNSLNGDINGIDGGINSSQSWSQLGALSRTYTPVSIEPVPEPPVRLCCLCGLALLFLRSRLKRWA